MKFSLALLLAGLIGFVALSWEILWYRVFAFVSKGAPTAFGLMLGAYLLGIAIGSAKVRSICKDDQENVGVKGKAGVSLAIFVALAGFASYLVAPALARLATVLHWTTALPLVALAAGLLGATLPLLCHFSVAADDKAAARISYVYLANILGSACGSLATGFVLMDAAEFPVIANLLFLASLSVALLIGLKSSLSKALVLGLFFAAVVLAYGLREPLHSGLYERLLFKKEYQKQRFKTLLENRQGVIAITDDDVVYGGGVYDGAVSTDLMTDINWVIRPYFLCALKRQPKSALVVGMSMGAWTQIVANLPGMESVTVVEINPGYLDLIKNYPAVASILDDPRIQIVIDDGRRWISKHPEKKFDLIVQNTTWHWRSHVTNLLSREYLALCKDRLNDDGLLMFNTTFSEDAMRTACAVFDQGLRVYNNMLMAKTPLAFSKEDWRLDLMNMRINGKKLFNLGRPQDRNRLEEVLSLVDTLNSGAKNEVLESRGHLLQRLGSEPIITDDNMLSEFRSLAW